MVSIGDVKDLIDISIEVGKIINTVITDVRNADSRQRELLSQAVSELSTINQYEGFLRKLPAEQLDAIGDRLRRMRDGAKELQELISRLRTYGKLDWALGKKAKVEAMCAQIKEEQDNLSLRLVALRVFGSMYDAGNGTSDTEKTINLIQKSIARRRDIQQQGGPSLELDPARLPSAGNLSVIAGSNLLVGTAPSGDCMVIEDYPFEGAKDHDVTLARIRDVASTFHAKGSEERNSQAIKASVAQCLGYLALPQSFQLVCEMPRNVVQVQSLRELLQRPKEYSLNIRVELARSLAKAVFFTHAYQYVHKGIRPANILLTQREVQLSTLGPLLLAGFGTARAEHAMTSRLGDGKKKHELDIYRHPSRIDEQGGLILEKYTFLHDVYSLGVCLLEIGLWQNFLDAQKFRPLHDAPPVNRQRLLKALARKSLSLEMGHIYTDVVLKCLDGADGAFLEAGGHADDTSVGLGYIEAVLDDLGRITV